MEEEGKAKVAYGRGKAKVAYGRRKAKVAYGEKEKATLAYTFPLRPGSPPFVLFRAARGADFCCSPARRRAPRLPHTRYSPPDSPPPAGRLCALSHRPLEQPGHRGRGTGTGAGGGVGWRGGEGGEPRFSVEGTAGDLGLESSDVLRHAKRSARRSKSTRKIRMSV